MLYPNLATTFQTIARKDAEFYMGYVEGSSLPTNLGFDLGKGMPDWVGYAFERQPQRFTERWEVLAS